MPNAPDKPMTPDEAAAYAQASSLIAEAMKEKNQVLDLSSLGLAMLPDSIGLLTQIQKLSLGNNRLTTLPDSIAKLTHLQKLDLSRNHLATLPDSIGELWELKILYLNNNQLTMLPDSILRLKQLQILNLNRNELTMLPDSIGHLVQLRELSFFQNQLTTLPYSIGQLAQLRFLSLTGNRLSMLPDSIGQLLLLQTLYLDDNRFTILPESLRKLGRLTALFLHNNPGLDLPAEILGPSWQVVKLQSKEPKPAAEILDYYFSTRGNQGVPLREMKLIVVGRGKSGKTTIVKRLHGEPMDEHEPETHGIFRTPLMLQCSDGPMQVRVWDFGGQTVLHSMHEFFFTARSLYLLVLEQRGDSDERDAKYWLQLIRSHAPDAPVVVAFNKSKGVIRPLDRTTLNELYGPIVAWVPTECLPDDDCPGAEQSIKNLLDALTKAADKMEEPRKRFPRKFTAIKEWLEAEGAKKITYLEEKQFRDGCVARHMTERKDQDAVAELMHELGVAMNYARDERLRDTTVLSPDWLANGIYAILRANMMLPDRQLVPDAILTEAKIGEILAVAAQPPIEMLDAHVYSGKWDFLLRLMNLFQLSFPLDEGFSRQLCPTLLGAEPPAGTDEPADGERVQLRYEFEVLPAPLLPRFIVQNFGLINRELLWQRGAMLRYEDARAKVWATADEKYLFATASGKESDRRELLAIIRGTLASLFKEYKRLRVTEQFMFSDQWVPVAALKKLNVDLPDLGPHDGNDQNQDRT